MIYRRKKQNRVTISIQLPSKYAPNFSKRKLGIDFLDLDGYNKCAIKRKIAE